MSNGVIFFVFADEKSQIRKTHFRIREINKDGVWIT